MIFEEKTAKTLVIDLLVLIAIEFLEQSFDFLRRHGVSVQFFDSLEKLVFLNETIVVFVEFLEEFLHFALFLFQSQVSVHELPGQVLQFVAILTKLVVNFPNSLNFT